MNKAHLPRKAILACAAFMLVVLVGCSPLAESPSMRMNKGNDALFLQCTERLVVVVSPEPATALSLSWRSSDPAVAVVDGDGNVLALTIGYSEITATDQDGRVASCAVRVRPLPVLGTVDASMLPTYQAALATSTLPTGLVAGDPLPANVDLRPYVGGGWDQGSQGSCVAFALAEYITFHETWDAGLSAADSLHEFSPAFIYNQLASTSESGITMDSGLNFIKSTGDCLESLMGYDANPFPKAPTQAASDNALLHKISSFAAVGTDIATLKLYLGHGMPIFVAMLAYPDLFSLNDSNPVYDTKPIPAPTSTGYHAVLLVGYNDSANGGKGALLFRNSWGDYWGIEGGDGYIDYAFFPLVAYVAYRLGELPIPPPALGP